MRKPFFSLLLVVLLIISSLLLPLPAGLSREGLSGLALLVSVVVLYATEALPLIVTSLLALALMPILSVLSIGEVWPAFGNSAIFFMLASFGISAAFKNTNIPQIITRFILRWSKGNARKLCIGFMSGAALVSSVMSDIPTCVMFGALALGLLEATGEDNPGESRLGRMLMIAVPCGAIIGGFATPAGNGLNVLVMNAVREVGGIDLTFIQWMAMGVPLAISMVVVCGLWLHVFAKPDNPDPKSIAKVIDNLAGDSKLTVVDAKFVIVLLGMISLWIASSWVPAINVTLVSIFGVTVMHLPGIALLKGRDFADGISWDAFIMCGSIIALGTGVQSTGAIAWIVNLALGGVSGWPTIAILLVLSVIPCLVHMATPAAGAIYALTCIPLLTAAAILGFDPRVVGLIVGVWICTTFMQPLDLVYLLTYSNGYYTMGNLAKFGVLPTLVLLALTVTWIPAVCGLM